MVSCGVVDVEEGCDDCFNVCVFVFVVVKKEVEEGRERERGGKLIYDGGCCLPSSSHACRVARGSDKK